MSAAAIFKRRLSHTVEIDYETIFESPQLEISLNFARTINASVRSSSSDGQPITLYQEEVTIDKRQSRHTTPLRGFVFFSKADPIVRNLLSEVPELTAELRDQWEATISSYIQKAAEGVWIGKLRVVVHVSLVTEIDCCNKKRKRP